DLLGVRYLLQASRQPAPGWDKVIEDWHPAAYAIFRGGGRRDLEPFTLYKNETVLPRAFVVPRRGPLPEPPRVLQAMKNTDFKETVLLEVCPAASGAVTPGGKYRPARVRDYRPNRVVVELDGTSGGFLVLADVWFPGWTCTIDGEPAPLYRAN